MNKPRFLVIDDEKDFVEFFTHLLEISNIDCEVVGCTTPARALRALETEKFDAVFTDFDMYGENGSVISKMARHCQPTARVIMVTSRSQDEIHESCRAHAYIQKSVKLYGDFGKFGTLVRRALGPVLTEESAVNELTRQHSA